MLQITAILAIIYVLIIIYDFHKYKEHFLDWEEIQEDAKEEK